MELMLYLYMYQLITKFRTSILIWVQHSVIFFEKGIFLENSADDKIMQDFPACKELNFSIRILHIKSEIFLKLSPMHSSVNHDLKSAKILNTL